MSILYNSITNLHRAIKLDSLSFDSLSKVDANWVERLFEEWEVLEVVRAINGDKARGPDDLSMAFFQAYWNVLKEYIMKVFYDFHA